MGSTKRLTQNLPPFQTLISLTAGYAPTAFPTPAPLTNPFAVLTPATVPGQLKRFNIV